MWNRDQGAGHKLSAEKEGRGREKEREREEGEREGWYRKGGEVGGGWCPEYRG